MTKSPTQLEWYRVAVYAKLPGERVKTLTAGHGARVTGADLIQISR